MAIPSLEAIDAEQPETGAHVGQNDEPVVVPDIDTERALLDARRALPAVVRRAAEAVPMLALAREPVPNRLRILRIFEVEYLETVLVRRDEHIRPTHFVIV